MQALAALLYGETEPEKLTLSAIEEAIREHMQTRVNPASRKFFISESRLTSTERSRTIASTLGEIRITERQAQHFELKARSQWSPYPEKCLLVSAIASYERSEEDLKKQRCAYLNGALSA